MLMSTESMYLMLISNKCTRFLSQITIRTTFSCKTQVLNYFPALLTSNKTLWVVFWLVCGTIRDWLVPNWSQKVSWHQDIFFRIGQGYQPKQSSTCFVRSESDGKRLGTRVLQEQVARVVIWDKKLEHLFEINIRYRDHNIQPTS